MNRARYQKMKEHMKRWGEGVIIGIVTAVVIIVAEKTWIRPRLFPYLIALAVLIAISVWPAARGYINNILYLIVRLDRVRQTVQRLNDLEHAVAEARKGHEVEARLEYVATALTPEEVADALERLREACTTVADADSAKVAMSLSLRELYDKWGERVSPQYFRIRAELATGDPREKTETWRAICWSLRRDLRSRLGTKDISMLDDWCQELNRHLQCLKKYGDDEVVSSLRKSLHEVMLHVMDDRQLDRGCISALIEAIPTLRKKENLPKAMSWAGKRFEQHPNAQGNAVAQCLIKLEEDIVDVDPQVLGMILSHDLEPFLRGRLEGCSTVLAVRRGDGPGNGRIWKRIHCEDIVVQCSTKREWRVKSTSMGGTWGIDCDEAFESALGPVEYRFSSGGATEQIEIDSCVVARPHFNNPVKGRGLIFKALTGSNRRALYDYLCRFPEAR